MDYNIKYLKYKNKYINLKNMIGNGKESKEEKATNLALRAEYKKRLLEVGITNNFFNRYVNKFVDKIMENKLDIDNIIKLYIDFKKNIISDNFCSKIIYDILIRYHDSPKEQIDFLIELFSSNFYVFEGINKYKNSEFYIIGVYYNFIRDPIFQLFKNILILNKNKNIDIYYLLSNLYLIIEKCPSIKSYIEYIIEVKNIDVINYYFLEKKNRKDETGDEYYYPKGNPVEKKNLMISILIFYKFDITIANEFINHKYTEIKWNDLEEIIQLFIKYKEREKENIYKFIKKRLEEEDDYNGVNSVNFL